MMWLVTGGAGFIGSHFYDLLISRDEKVQVIDALTYASKKERVDPKHLVVADICDPAAARDMMMTHPDVIVNFAAESHVDNAYRQTPSFTRSNIDGVVNLLEAMRELAPDALFVQASTDEVYGDAPTPHDADSPLNPQNPYAATKAAAEYMVNAYARSFGLRTMITRSSNNWGPRQHPEKLIPAALQAKVTGDEMIIHGLDLQRDFIHVEDNVKAIYELAAYVQIGTWNIASGNQVTIREVLRRIGNVPFRLSCERPGVDLGYWVDPERTWELLGWRPPRWEEDERWNQYASEAIRPEGVR